jgi:3'-phosphoadenosine 5'-phosphosulfate sulfotransferase (PAPS reductase)/FAD synthetase
MDTALQFSGGKDSLACLYLHRDRWDEILVCWVNTGAAYPEVVEYMRGWAARLPHFLEIASDQQAQIERNGYPSEVVPLNYSPFGRAHVKGVGALKIQSYFGCCAENIWFPMQAEMHRRGIRKIIRGQRRQERRTGIVTNGYIDTQGIEYVLPIENWTEQQVFDYLREVGAELPPYYATERTSRDCWDCTAYLDENVERIRNLPPAKRAVVTQRLSAIHSAIEREAELMRGLI